MLFNTYEFVFLQLPIVLIGFFQVVRTNHTWLGLANYNLGKA